MLYNSRSVLKLLAEIQKYRVFSGNSDTITEITTTK